MLFIAEILEKKFPFLKNDIRGKPVALARIILALKTSSRFRIFIKIKNSGNPEFTYARIRFININPYSF